MIPIVVYNEDEGDCGEENDDDEERQDGPQVVVVVVDLVVRLF